MADPHPKAGVGYKSPPQSGKFTKGKSGNPGGRPKGRKSMLSLVQEEACRLVWVKEPGGEQKQVTQQQLIFRIMHMKAANGDIKAFNSLCPFWKEAELVSQDGNAETKALIFQSIAQYLYKSQSTPDQLAQILRLFKEITADAQPDDGS